MARKRYLNRVKDDKTKNAEETPRNAEQLVQQEG